MGAYVNQSRTFAAKIGLVLGLVLGLNMTSARAAEPVVILALGDSLTAGYGLAPGLSFPDQLQAALRDKGYGITIVNGGVSGDTSAGGRSRLAWLMQTPDGNLTPDAVIVVLGANDGLRGLDPAETRANLDAIVSELKSNGVPVLIAGLQAPPNLGADYVAEFNAIYPTLADTHAALLYPFFLEGVAAVPALNQDDGIHPNAEGVASIVKQMLPSVEKLIARVHAP